MEAYQRFAVVTVLMVTMLVAACDAQTICNVSAQDLMSCKESVTPPNPPPPTPQCCSVLSRADLPCFCSCLSNPALPGLGIDPELAKQLPKKCNLAAPNC